MADARTLIGVHAVSSWAKTQKPTNCHKQPNRHPGRELRVLGVLLFSALSSFAGTVTGTVQRPNGQPLTNASINFTLSQAGTVPSSLLTVTTDPVYCGTDDSGNVVGVARSVVSPVLSATLGVGSLPAATYYVELSYWNASGETLVGPELSFILSGTGTLNVAAPVLQPSAASGYKVYIGSTSGGEKLQSTITGWAPYGQSASLANVTSPPVSNSTTCTGILFNDVIVPSYTTYSVNLVDQNGKQVPGYPQRFYLQGSTVDLSSLTPASNLYAKFPNAIVAQPSGNAQQSIAGPLTLGAYGFTAGAGNFSGIVTAQQFKLLGGTGFSLLCAQQQGSVLTFAGVQQTLLTCTLPANSLQVGNELVVSAQAFDIGSVSCSYGWVIGSSLTPQDPGIKVAAATTAQYVKSTTTIPISTANGTVQATSESWTSSASLPYAFFGANSYTYNIANTIPISFAANCASGSVQGFNLLVYKLN
jgi:hypothetical protein